MLSIQERVPALKDRDIKEFFCVSCETAFRSAVNLGGTTVVYRPIVFAM